MMMMIMMMMIIIIIIMCWYKTLLHFDRSLMVERLKIPLITIIHAKGALLQLLQFGSAILRPRREIPWIVG